MVGVLKTMEQAHSISYSNGHLKYLLQEEYSAIET